MRRRRKMNGKTKDCGMNERMDLATDGDPASSCGLLVDGLSSEQKKTSLSLLLSSMWPAIALYIYPHFKNLFKV